MRPLNFPQQASMMDVRSVKYSLKDFDSALWKKWRGRYQEIRAILDSGCYVQRDIEIPINVETHKIEPGEMAVPMFGTPVLIGAAYGLKLAEEMMDFKSE